MYIMNKVVRIIPFTKPTTCLTMSTIIDRPKLEISPSYNTERSLWEIIHNKCIRNYCYPSYYLKYRRMQQKMELGLIPSELDINIIKENENTMLCNIGPLYNGGYMKDDCCVYNDPYLWIMNKLEV